MHCFIKFHLFLQPGTEGMTDDVGIFVQFSHIAYVLSASFGVHSSPSRAYAKSQRAANWWLSNCCIQSSKHDSSIFAYFVLLFPFFLTKLLLWSQQAYGVSSQSGYVPPSQSVPLSNFEPCTLLLHSTDGNAYMCYSAI